MQEQSESIPITEPVENAAHEEPLAKICVMDIDNMSNAEDQTEMRKKDGTALTKAEMTARIALHGMLTNQNHVDRSKPTSENDARTSAADVEDPIMENAMKKRQREDDTNIQTQPEPCQTKHEAANGCMMKEVKEDDLIAKQEPKRKAARKPSMRRAMMSPQPSVEQFMQRFRGGKAT